MMYLKHILSMSAVFVLMFSLYLSFGHFSLVSADTSDDPHVFCVFQHSGYFPSSSQPLDTLLWSFKTSDNHSTAHIIWAQYSPDGKFYPLTSPINITTPSNTTYVSSPSTLNITTSTMLSPSLYQYDLIYSVDGQENVTVPVSSFTFELPEASGPAPAKFSAYTALPQFCQGAHNITVYATYTLINSTNSNLPVLLLSNSTVLFTIAPMSTSAPSVLLPSPSPTLKPTQNPILPSHVATSTPTLLPTVNLNPTETPPSASTIHTTAYSTGTEQTEEQQTLAPHQNELLLVNVGVAAVAVVVVLFMLGKRTPN